MADKNLPAIGNQSFEELKKLNDFSAEYWSARELQPLLGYSQWRRFEDAIKRAIISCEQSGNKSEYHFAGAGKMIGIGKGGERQVEDYQLSRFACYLIAQNGDPRKPEIAHAQKYFAIQARKQELTEQLAADQERLELRKQTSEEFKALSGAARQAGVQDRMFGVFHDAGYRGLYGGLGREAIKKRKGIPEKEQLLDRMNATELAANQFRMTQTRDKLARETSITNSALFRRMSKSVKRSVPRLSASAVRRRSKFHLPSISRKSKNVSNLPCQKCNWLIRMQVVCWDKRAKSNHVRLQLFRNQGSRQCLRQGMARRNV